MTNDDVIKCEKPLIPSSRDLPYLITPDPAGSDPSNNYINAVFGDSFLTRRDLIITQMPLPHTVGDFWRLIHDYRLVSNNEWFSGRIILHKILKRVEKSLIFLIFENLVEEIARYLKLSRIIVFWVVIKLHLAIAAIFCLETSRSLPILGHITRIVQNKKESSIFLKI